MNIHPAARLAHVQPFHVMETAVRARELEKQGRDVIHMEVGEPDFPTPAPIVAAAQEYIASGRVFYTSALGLPELRAAIAGFYASRYGLSIPASRVVVTAGASAALLLALASLVEAGSEWLVTDPCYPCNVNFIRCFDGVPVPIPVSADTNFQPTAAAIDRYWTERTAGALFASPANPTGTIFEDAVLADIAARVRARGGQLIMDEIYHGLTYERDVPTALRYDDDVFVVQSFSKYFNMTGWRLGWLIVPETWVRRIELLAQNLYLSPASPSQYAALAAFRPETIDILETRRAEFKRRRDFLAPALESLGFRLTARPDGAFYVYADCSQLTDDSNAFAHQLLEKAGVAVAPGLDFGTLAPKSHLRIAYTNGVDRLEEAVTRIRKFL